MCLFRAVTHFEYPFEVMKKSTKVITEARKLWEVSTKAAEAESRARSARVEVRVAKVKFKTARKQFKQAKKAAKAAIRDAEAIQRVLKAVAATVSKAAAQPEILRPAARAAGSRTSRRRSNVTRPLRTSSAGTASRQATDIQFEEVARSASAESLSSARKIPGFLSI